jgi:hypothetical protein
MRRKLGSKDLNKIVPVYRDYAMKGCKGSEGYAP